MVYAGVSNAPIFGYESSNLSARTNLKDNDMEIIGFVLIIGAIWYITVGNR